MSQRGPHGHELPTSFSVRNDSDDASPLPSKSTQEQLEEIVHCSSPTGSVCVGGVEHLSQQVMLCTRGGTSPMPLVQGSEAIRAALEHSSSLSRAVKQCSCTVLEAEHVSFGGSGWEETLKAIVRRASRMLGCDGEYVQAVPRRMVISTTGDVPALCGAEKSGAFATLLIRLPSNASGGTLSVVHNGCTITQTLGDGSDSRGRSCAFAAYYNDFTPEISEVTSGIHVVMVYELFYDGAIGRPNARELASDRLAAEAIYSWDRLSHPLLLETYSAVGGAEGLAGTHDALPEELRRPALLLSSGNVLVPQQCRLRLYLVRVHRDKVYEWGHRGRSHGSVTEAKISTIQLVCSDGVGRTQLEDKILRWRGIAFREADIIHVGPHLEARTAQLGSSSRESCGILIFPERWTQIITEHGPCMAAVESAVGKLEQNMREGAGGDDDELTRILLLGMKHIEREFNSISDEGLACCLRLLPLHGDRFIALVQQMVGQGALNARKEGGSRPKRYTASLVALFSVLLQHRLLGRFECDKQEGDNQGSHASGVAGQLPASGTAVDTSSLGTRSDELAVHFFHLLRAQGEQKELSVTLYTELLRALALATPKPREDTLRILIDVARHVSRSGRVKNECAELLIHSVFDIAAAYGWDKVTAILPHVCCFAPNVAVTALERIRREIEAHSDSSAVLREVLEVVEGTISSACATASGFVEAACFKRLFSLYCGESKGVKMMMEVCLAASCSWYCVPALSRALRTFTEENISRQCTADVFKNIHDRLLSTLKDTIETPLPPSRRMGYYVESMEKTALKIRGAAIWELAGVVDLAFQLDCIAIVHDALILLASYCTFPAVLMSTVRSFPTSVRACGAEALSPRIMELVSDRARYGKEEDWLADLLVASEFFFEHEQLEMFVKVTDLFADSLEDNKTSITMLQELAGGGGEWRQAVLDVAGSAVLQKMKFVLDYFPKWSMPLAECRDENLQKFLRSNETQTRIMNPGHWRSAADAQQFRVEGEHHSLKYSVGGSGDGLFVLITKTLEWRRKQAEKEQRYAKWIPLIQSLVSPTVGSKRRMTSRSYIDTHLKRRKLEPSFCMIEHDIDREVATEPQRLELTLLLHSMRVEPLSHEIVEESVRTEKFMSQDKSDDNGCAVC